MMMKTRPKAYRYAENVLLAAIILVVGGMYVAEVDEQRGVACIDSVTYPPVNINADLNKYTIF